MVLTPPVSQDRRTLAADSHRRHSSRPDLWRLAEALTIAFCSARHALSQCTVHLWNEHRAINVCRSFRLRALLLVLLPSSQYLQMASFLGEELLGCANEAGGALLLDLVLLDQACFLGLDDLLSRPGAALRRPASMVSERSRCVRQAGQTSGAPRRVWTS
jgi:hypothetical protein